MDQTKAHRKYREKYTRTVHELMLASKLPPAEVSTLARKRISEEWKTEFGQDAPETWIPPAAELN